MRKKLTSFSGTSKYLRKKDSLAIKKKKIKKEEEGLSTLSRTFLSSLIIISIFFIAPIIISFTKDRTLLSKNFENNSKNNLEKLLEKKKY